MFQTSNTVEVSKKFSDSRWKNEIQKKIQIMKQRISGEIRRTSCEEATEAYIALLKLESRVYYRNSKFAHHGDGGSMSFFNISIKSGKKSEVLIITIPNCGFPTLKSIRTKKNTNSEGLRVFCANSSILI
jgi:hypothetical protein